MGLFDTVRCECPLPNPAHQGIEFQTKSLLCMFAHYTITGDGRLIEDTWRDGRHVPDREWPFHGDIVMCGSAPSKEWIEYLVRFTHGRVEWVRRLEEPAGGQEALQREIEVDERLVWPVPLGLVPGVRGRHLTADEFATYAPGKLELIDGGIPGGEGLLRLVLTSLGLRRAALMVGRREWRDVLEADSPENLPKTRNGGHSVIPEGPQKNR